MIYCCCCCCCCCCCISYSSIIPLVLVLPVNVLAAYHHYCIAIYCLLLYLVLMMDLSCIIDSLLCHHHVLGISSVCPHYDILTINYQCQANKNEKTYKGYFCKHFICIVLVMLWVNSLVRSRFHGTSNCKRKMQVLAHFTVSVT